RPSGPNPSFAAAAGGFGTQVALAHLAGYPTGFGVPVPFNSVDAQLSDASSWYHALTVDVQKRFSKGFMLFSSYTWSHSIDDGTDTRLDLGASEARPSLVSSGTTSPYISGAEFGVADVCLANDGSTFSVPFVTPPAGCDGSLGRNRFFTPGFFQFDLRLAKQI